MVTNLLEYQRHSDWTNHREPQHPPLVSVVIPTFNVRESLRKTLLSLTQQTVSGRHFEVLVIDNGSTDDALEMIKSLSLPFSLRYFYQPRSGRQVGKCRNIGIVNAEGKLIIFVDADCLCSSRLIQRHAELHAKKEKILIIGEIRMLDPQSCLDHEGKKVNVSLETLLLSKPPTIASFKGRLKMKALYFGQRMASGFSSKINYWMSGANSSVKRQHLWEVGGYDEAFDQHWGDEDAELGYRLEKIGLKVIYLHDAMIFHQWHPTSKSGMPGYNRILFLLKHPELIGTRLLMRQRNPYYGKTIEELERMMERVLEKARNYY